MRLLSVREATKPLPSSSDPEVGYACPPPWLPSLPQRHHPTSREAATAPGCLCWGPGAAALDRACLPLSGPAGRRLQALSSLPPSLAMVSRLVGGWAMAGWLAGPPGRLVVRTDPPPGTRARSACGPSLARAPPALPFLDPVLLPSTPDMPKSRRLTRYAYPGAPTLKYLPATQTPSLSRPPPTTTCPLQTPVAG